MRNKSFFTLLVLATLVLGGLVPVVNAMPLQQAALGSDAVVLVNSASASYGDFQHYVQPYLDHFGIPYTILDIATDSVGEGIGDYAVIIVGHRQLDTSDTHLDATEEDYISAAVSAGTGLVNFDNDLSVGGSTARYQFVQDIFGFGYMPPSTGSGVTFTSESGGGLQINCWEDDHQDPVLTTFTNAALFDDTDGEWDEFLWAGHRDYPGVFAGIPEATDGTLGTFHCFGDVPNGTYDVIANLYHSRNWRYYWGYTAADPRANSYDVTSGPSGDFAEFELDTITITDGSFDIYMNYGEDLGGTAFPYFGWSWIRLVPTSAPPPVMHYITERHTAGESIGTGGMTMAGITLPDGVTALAMTGSQPFLAVTTSGLGRAVQWGSYNWMSHSVKGPIYGLDDLVWRSIVWAARKPFVMQGLPPFITMRVDDESGPFGWAEIASEFGFKPWAGLFYHNVDATEAAQLSALVNAGKATAAVHAKSGAFFYYNHGVGDFPDAEIAANYAHATAWHATHNIPISKWVLPHYYEFGTNVFQGLSDWGVEFVGTMMNPGNGYGAPWVMNGPYRLYEGGGSSAGRPVYYADFMDIPEFEGQFFNCVTEIRDDAGYEWYPSNDVAGSIGRGTRQTKRALDSMALATLFTHGQHVHPISPSNWRAILQGITENLAPYSPIYVTMDHACQYVRAMHTSDITTSIYDPESRQVTTTLGGETDMPTMFYLFTEQGGDIRHVMVDVPVFSGSTDVDYTLAGPLDHIVITPASATVATLGSQQFTAQGYDVDDNPIPNLPFTWSVVNGGGTIDGNGLFTAGDVAGVYADTVEASFGGVSGYASVEVVAPALDHFTFEAIASPQYVGAPFQVSIAARDISGGLLLGYSGPAALSDSTGTIAPVVTGSFSGGMWTGEVTIGQAAHDVIITASDGDATGASDPFEVQEMPLFYQVTSPSYEHLAGDSFLVTVTAYEGTTINCWEDDHQDPVLATTTDPAPLQTTPGEWTEFWYVSGGRPFPSVMAEHNEYEDYGLPLMRFYASGIPNGEYEVIANLYESAPMRYFYGFTPGDPFAHYVDTPGGAPGTQHREYSLGTVIITDGTFNLYVQDADILGGTYPIFGWAWVRLVPVEAGLRINCWEDDHQDPVLVPFTNPGLLNDHDGKWDEFDYANRDYPSVMAGHNEWENNGLQPMHFFADGIPDGPYEVWANLYTGRQTRHYYGFTEAEALAETRWVDNVVGAGGTNQHAEYLLGVVEITDGRFDLWAGDGDSTSPYFYGWAWIRLVPAGITMSSSSPTMLFDADGDGTFGEPGDDVKPLVGGTFDIMARDTTAGTDVTIVATDVLGRFGYNTYIILSVNEPPVANDDEASTSEDTPVTIDAAENDTDVDGDLDPSSATVVSGPSNGTVINNGDGTFTYEPDSDFNGTDSFEYEICDTEELCDTATVTITINPVNDAPELDPIGDKTVAEETELTFTASASDLDIPANTLTFSLVDAPTGASIDPSSGAFTWTPTELQGPGDYTFDVCVTDDGTPNLTDCETITVSVSEVNLPPVLAEIGDKAVAEGTELTFTASASDLDIPANTLTFSLIGAPEGASIGSSSGVFTWTPTEAQGPGDYTFDVCVSDGALQDCETITVSVSEVNLPPVLAEIGDKTVRWDDTLAFTASASDPDIPANTLTFSLIDAPEGASIDPSSGAFIWTPTSSQIDSHTFTVRVTDNGTPSLYDEESITVTVEKRPTSVVYSGALSGQYSDSVELRATLTDAGTLNGTAISGKTIVFSLGSQDTSGVTGDSGEATAMLQLLQPEGSYSVDASFTGDDLYTGSSDSQTFTINAEDATVTFDDDNPVAVQVDTPGGDSGAFSLTVYVRETSPDAGDDPHPGDISLADVSLTLAPVGPGGPAAGTCMPSGVSGTDYNSVLRVTCSFNDVPVNTYTAEATVHGGYYAGTAEDVLVVYDPSLGFTTGGGWFYWPDTGERTNFGFTMKYNKKGTNVQGNLLLIRHLPDGSIYRVKSNALYGLALGDESDFGWASFSGKSTYKEPDWPEPKGNYEFVVYVEDWDEPGTGTDRFWIEVIEGMSMSSPANEKAVAIQGGNIAVPHGGKDGGKDK